MNLKLAQALNLRATHRTILVMRRSLDGEEDQGAKVPTAVRDPGRRARCVRSAGQHRGFAVTHGHSSQAADVRTDRSATSRLRPSKQGVRVYRG